MEEKGRNGNTLPFIFHSCLGEEGISFIDFTANNGALASEGRRVDQRLCARRYNRSA